MDVCMQCRLFHNATKPEMSGTLLDSMKRALTDLDRCSIGQDPRPGAPVGW